MDTVATLCEVCSTLNVKHLAHPLLPCRSPPLCSTPPIGYLGAHIDLGSIDEIKRRRSACAVCKLVAASLDEEPSDLDGRCRLQESTEFCNFRLPPHVAARDPTVTHVHLTQIVVIFDTTEANRFHGPSLPWETKTREDRASHYILNFQVGDLRVLIRLMLTNRMQTRARSYPQTRDQTLGIAQTEQAFLETIGGRYVGTQVNAQLIRAWVHECEHEHGNACMSSMRGRAEGKGPTFVVDVIQLCLVDTPPQCRYIALSYVWGTAAVFRHLLENTQDLRKTSSLRLLPIPATIRDAMILVHAIGERYLWVDSICIIQDDLKMQQTEIMQMGSIYSKAVFTIIAAAGDHANSGLPGVEPGSREQIQKVVRLANCELLTVIDVHKRQSGIDASVWAQRAWTFQERVLSNRVLVFSGNQVYWSCCAVSHSEERALEHVEGIHRLHLAFPQKPAKENLPWESLRPLEYSKLYDALLFSYLKRHLTYQTDILNAFNGVTEILAAIQNDTFFWGLPESFFSYAVTWCLAGYSSRNNIQVPIFNSNGSKEIVPIPSWSWAAWSGEEATYRSGFTGGGQNAVRSVIQFSIVDSTHRLVRIKERPFQDDLADRIRPSWQNVVQPSPHPSLPPHSRAQAGQLHFWTSFANVRAVRRWILKGRVVDYTLIVPPDVEPDLSESPHERPEIVHQDFIVIAARSDEARLILLAIEWKEGVAYRTGITEVEEADWVQMKNRQWRLVTLG